MYIIYFDHVHPYFLPVPSNPADSIFSPQLLSLIFGVPVSLTGLIVYSYVNERLFTGTQTAC